MGFVNPPAELPPSVEHQTVYSQLLDHQIGYNIYLPPGYDDGGERYPVAYHLHGWQGNESTDIRPLETVCQSRAAITVFVNAVSLEDKYLDALWQIEAFLIRELLPHIDGRHKTLATRENRMLSGFSMGGNMAFYIAVKHPELFRSVTAYAGTYHHLYHKGERTVGVAPEQVGELYEEMVREHWDLEEHNILCLVRQNAGAIRGKLNIALHIGTEDILFSDNELLHRYLESLRIPHEYRKYAGIAHELEQIL